MATNLQYMHDGCGPISGLNFNAGMKKPPVRETRPAWRVNSKPIEQKHYFGEKHYSPVELGRLWGFSARFIRTLFKDEPGVIVIDRPEERFKRGYSTIRIPLSLAQRVHERLTKR